MLWGHHRDSYDLIIGSNPYRNQIDDQSFDGIIDEECTRILAKRQPAATDLRMILSISKAVGELERMGDEAKKIANHALKLINEGESPRGYVEISRIGQLVTRMVRESLDAYARLDIDLAVSVAKADRTVDLEYKTAIRSLITYMMEDPKNIPHILQVMWSARAIERVGDRCQNICEYIIYFVKGKVVRHTTSEDFESLS